MMLDRKTLEHPDKNPNDMLKKMSCMHQTQSPGTQVPYIYIYIYET